MKAPKDFPQLPKITLCPQMSNFYFTLTLQNSLLPQVYKIFKIKSNLILHFYALKTWVFTVQPNYNTIILSYDMRKFQGRKEKDNYLKVT